MKKRNNEETMTFRSAAELRALDRAELRVKRAGLSRIIGSRVLHEENVRDAKITMVIGAPRRVEADHWLCPYRIEGIVDSDIEYGYGVDAIQALLNALGGIRNHLERTKRRFIFFGANHGIPMQVSTDYGTNLERRIERVIHQELKREQFQRLRQWKAEIAAGEARLKDLKDYVARWPQPSTFLAREIAKTESRMKAARKRAREWETNLRKQK